MPVSLKPKRAISKLFFCLDQMTIRPRTNHASCKTKRTLKLFPRYYHKGWSILCITNITFFFGQPKKKQHRQTNKTSKTSPNFSRPLKKKWPQKMRTNIHRLLKNRGFLHYQGIQKIPHKKWPPFPDVPRHQVITFHGRQHRLPTRFHLDEGWKGPNGGSGGYSSQRFVSLRDF